MFGRVFHFDWDEQRGQLVLAPPQLAAWERANLEIIRRRVEHGEQWADLLNDKQLARLRFVQWSLMRQHTAFDEYSERVHDREEA